MYNLWNFFLTRRAFTLLLMGALTVLSVYSLWNMPKESTPEVVIPMGIVTTTLPGATASDVERLITDELEPTIRSIADVDDVTSSSRQGVSVITAEFNTGVDIDSSIQDLRSAIDRVKQNLPTDANAPRITKVDFQDQPIMMVGIGSDLAPETLSSLGDSLEDELTAISGVSKVNVSGVREREISVVVHKDALTRHNTSLTAVSSALSAANAASPAGNLTIAGVEYPIQFEGDIPDVATLRNIPISTPSGTITLSNVATVIDGFEKTSSISRLHVTGAESQFALSLNIYKSKGESILAVAERVETRLAELEGTLLAGSEAVTTYSAADEVRTNIKDLTRSGLQTVTLVMIVLFLAIGIREALIAAVAIPFSFMISFIAMYATGNSVNFLSLFALIIAIGIIVDSGIVVVEALHTNRENGMKKLDAARAALKEFGWPLIAGTMTTVGVFVPLFFLTGIIGEFVKAIPFTIIGVLIASIIVSLGFIPTIALGLIRHEENALARYRENLWHTIEKRYQTLMQKLFAERRYQRRFYAFLGIAFVGGLLLPITGMLKVAMFPPADQDFFYVEIELPQATALAETDKITRKVEDLLADTPYMTSLMTTVGASSAFNQNGSSQNGKYANITINLNEDRPSSETSIKLAAEVRAELDNANLGKANVSVVEATGGPPSGAPIVVKVWSDETDALAVATARVERIIEDNQDTRDISSSLDNDGTELQINVDRAKAQEYGVATRDVARTIQTAVAGVDVTTLRIGGNDVDVRIGLDLNENFVDPSERTTTDVDSITTIPISTPRGTIPLGSLVTITADRASAAIAHEDGLRIGTVQAYVIDGANAVEVTNAIRSATNDIDLPDGVRLTFGGDDEEIKQTFSEMLFALIAGLALMFAILVLEFNAFRTSLRLLAAIPLSLAGVLWGLWLMGEPLSFTAFLGIIALAGVVINNGILLLDNLNTRRTSHPDMSPDELVLKSATSRVRPILLTTVTTVVGMIPLVFVSTMWAPLAYTIAFGLIYATLLTLVFVPLRSYRREVKTRSKQ